MHGSSICITSISLQNFEPAQIRACRTRVRFSFVTLRCVTMRQDIISIFDNVLFWIFRNPYPCLLIAWFSPSFTARYRIFHKIPYYRNRFLTHRGGTQLAAWKTRPRGAALGHELFPSQNPEYLLFGRSQRKAVNPEWRKRILFSFFSPRFHGPWLS